VISRDFFREEVFIKIFINRDMCDACFYPRTSYPDPDVEGPVKISRYNDNYFCKVFAVTFDKEEGLLSVAYHCTGNMSLGPLQSPQSSQLTFEANVCGRKKCNPIKKLRLSSHACFESSNNVQRGVLRYEVAKALPDLLTRRQVEFVYGSSGYSMISLRVARNPKHAMTTFLALDIEGSEQVAPGPLLWDQWRVVLEFLPTMSAVWGLAGVCRSMRCQTLEHAIPLAVREALRPFALADPSDELLDYKLEELCKMVPRRAVVPEVMKERLRHFADVVYAGEELRRDKFVKETCTPDPDSIDVESI